MKLMTLKEIQLYSLEILKDVHKFCIENDIKYTLAYGTLIGAVRHKGFIPWDDDVDIMMTRENYEKFRRLYKGRKYKFVCREDDPGCLLNFGRVVDTQDTECATMIPWYLSEEKTGVWIDIFPMDFIPDDDDEFNRIFNTFTFMNAQCLLARKYISRPLKGLTAKMNFRLWKKNLSKKMHRKPQFGPSQISGMVVDMLHILDRGRTSSVCQLTTADIIKARFDASFFENLTTIEFEGEQLLCTRDYDAMLRKTYGDYMQLPPENKRRPDQLRYLRFFWK